LGSGSVSVAYSNLANGLTSGTTYYYCAIAQSSAGTGFGSIQSFSTSATSPTVNAVTPHVGRNNAPLSITSVTGANFASGATVKLVKSGQANISCSGFSFTSSTTLSNGSCNISGVVSGNWSIVITNPDLQTGTLSGGLYVSNLVVGGLISTTFDTGLINGGNFNSVLWRGALGTGGTTAVKFQLATSNCPNGAIDPPACSTGTWSFLGPGSTNLDLFYTTTGPNTPATVNPSSHKNKRYYRYKIFLEREDSATSPRVDDVIVNWSP